MAIFCGTDIVSVERIRHSIEELGDSFLKRIFTEAEIQYCEARKVSKYQSYAARFAVKEAVYKALSTNGQGEKNNFDQVSWCDAEVKHHESGKPYLAFHGALEEVMQKMHVTDKNVEISLSHDAAVAIAIVVIEKEGD